ncbi:ATP-binding cassette sub-family C member 4-like isoform X1 [Diprion similis]|uniref:ATP-binding cassette sub-family C member 4-like isoform X1 n=1 Tax=Diprion similis TaxID=362088 RepID=UPI001EF7F8A4|nr:ATP-binding cassette sub-family C member 4-like isoform X1 [Diprion similis]
MEPSKKRRDRKNLEENSNFLSLLFFGWTFPIFWKGSRHNLQLQDLYDPLKSDESEYLGDRLEREWKKELTKADRELLLRKDGVKQPRPRPSLMWALIRILWVPYLMQGLLLFGELMILRILQPILQGWIINYFNQVERETTRNEVLLYALYLVIVTLGIIFIIHHTNLRTQQTGMCARVACCSLIYRKVLRLDQAAMNNAAAGQVANLISNDVARFDLLPIFSHFVWIMPFQVVLIGYVMWQSVGVAALAGVVTMIIQAIPIQGSLSNISAKLRSKIAEKTDERVQLMSELISGIQVIKMYSWEKPFDLIVSKVRAAEMKLIGYTSYLRGIYLSIMLFSERITLFLTLIAFVLPGNSLTADITFSLATLFSVLQVTCAVCFPQAVVLAGETAVSLERLTDFLLLEEVKYPENFDSPINNGIQSVEKMTPNHRAKNGIGIEIANVAANWVHGQLPPTLCQISMDLKNQSLSVLVGSVGSGKSSLLHLILGELKVGAGNLSFYTSENGIKTSKNIRDIHISYASQEPWLFSASIRENILFGQSYDKTRYEEVTQVCALVKDFELLPQGDMSFVGERGASLSGGQRARINLARAVYRDADIYLLDDPLSAVDARVGRQLFEECINGFLKGKTRILVTHQLQYLRQAETIIVLNNGSIKCHGTYEELVQSNPHVLTFEKSEESNDDTSLENNCEEYAESKEIMPVTIVNGDGELKESAKSIEDPKDVTDEEVETGQLSNQVYWSYFLAGGNICSLILIALGFVIAQVAASGTDYWVTYWTNQEARRIKLKSANYDTNDTSHGNDTGNTQRDSSYQSDWFDEFGLLKQDVTIYVYAGCVIGCIILVTLRSMLFVKMCVSASHNIHNSMFSNLLLATMRFFNNNPSGRILNRFSKDIGTMDELLPKTMLEAIQILAMMVGMLVMVAVVNPWMIIPIIIIGGVFYTVRFYYLKTAQDIKRLEGIAKSPMFSHVSSTLDGLTTIRSRGAPAELMLKKEFDRLQDVHTSAWYLAIAGTSVLGLVLDLFSGALVACVCFSFILMDDGNFLGGSVGLAISQSLAMTGWFQYGVRQAAEVVSQMTSVERVLQYTNLPKEGPFTTEKPPPVTWPSNGGLTFKNVFMKYADNKPPVLKNLNVKINPGWKVGIVGRTGAGKSSLISALFRLTGEGLEGEIGLDGIDTKSVGLHELRPRISIIPQEPILFSASLRYNLDPFEQYSDAVLWDSLREVELGNAVQSLGFQVAGGGANFSVGQRQLICLARAILRNNRLLVLDEATANIDRRTDALIQDTIRRRFADCTVLTIAHRLNTIMDSDRVLVMAEGRIVEFNHPHLLLKNRNGHFFQMLQQTGKTMAEKLSEIAESSYLRSSEIHKQASTTPNDTVNEDETPLQSLSLTEDCKDR